MAQQCFTTSLAATFCADGQSSTSIATHCTSASLPVLCQSPAATDITGTTAETCWWCAINPSRSSAVESAASATTTPSTSSTDTGTTSLSSATSAVSNTSPSSITLGPTSLTTSKSSTASAPSSSTNTSSGTILTPGVGVGIGLGGALFGALLVGFIAFVLFHRKRRQRSYPQPQSPHNGMENVAPEKYGMVVTERKVRGGTLGTATNFERLLPLPAEDDAIIGGLSKIRDSIKNHVQNYYHTGSVSPGGVDELRLAELSQATGIQTPALLNLLFNPATRLPTIRLFLGHLIISRLQGRIDGKPSFLPNEVSGMVASQSSVSANSYQAQPLLFSKWKVISGVLLQQQYGEAPGDHDVRNGNIAQILAAAEPILSPFVNPNIDTKARQHHLEGVMRRAAQFAFLLFSQPGSFSFDFRGPGEASSLLVFPVFLQTVSDEAEILSPPRLLSGGELLSGM